MIYPNCIHAVSFKAVSNKKIGVLVITHVLFHSYLPGQSSRQRTQQLWNDEMERDFWHGERGWVETLEWGGGVEGLRVEAKQDLIHWNWVNVLWSVPCTTHVHWDAKSAQNLFRNVVLDVGSDKDSSQAGAKGRRNPLCEPLCVTYRDNRGCESAFDSERGEKKER